MFQVVMRQQSLSKLAVLSKKAPSCCNLWLQFRPQTLAVHFSSSNRLAIKQQKKDVTKHATSVSVAKTVPKATKTFASVTKPARLTDVVVSRPTDFRAATYSPFGAGGPAAELLEDVSSVGAKYEGEKIGDQHHGRGKLEWTVKQQWRMYHGDFIFGTRTGRGHYRSQSGVEYEGVWVNNRPQGRGKLSIPIDATTTLNCKGSFLNGQLHGPGTLTVQNKASIEYEYTGSFVHGQKSGSGVSTLSSLKSTSVHEGSYKNNQKEGLGTQTITNTAMGFTKVYRGHFVDDLFSGQGEITYTLHDNTPTKPFVVPTQLPESAENSDDSAKVSSKEVYIFRHFIDAQNYTYCGAFLDNKFHGEGVLNSAKMKIEGVFAHGVPDGNGTVTYFDNSTYTGTLRGLRKVGVGKTTNAEGVVYEGEFAYDMRHGQGKLTFPQGNTYTGTFVRDKLTDCSHATVHLSHGGVYEGQFAHGEMHGKGVITYPDNTAYVGTFERNKPFNGEGVYVNKHYVLHKGVWKEGKFTGEKKEILQLGEKNEQGKRWPDAAASVPTGVVSDATKVVENGTEPTTTATTATTTAAVTPTSVTTTVTAAAAAAKSLPPPVIVRKIDNKGIIYEGEFHNGYRHGYGITTYPEGKVYKGNYVYDIRSGYGEMTYHTGHSITGIFKDNRIYHGKGAIVYDHYIEIGEWFEGARVGQAQNIKRDGTAVISGVCENGAFVPHYMVTNAKDTLYEGEVKDYKRHGKGKLTFPDGTVYEGDFVSGSRHGQGTLTSENGIYTGEWVNDMQHGEGEYKYIAGHSYVGHFKYDKKDGYGVFKYNEGGTYEGEWRHDVQEGLGKHINGDGTYFEGVFSQGRIVNGTRSYKDGNMYQGSFRKGRRHGEGNMTFPDGTVFSGTFQENKPDDQGKIVTSHGVYEGEIFEFKPHGVGVYKYNNGTVYEGNFARGQRDGWAKVRYVEQNEQLEGQFMFDRLFKGRGVLYNSDGSYYKGEIDNFKYTTGILTYVNGTTYEGSFQENLPYDGNGCGSIGNGDVYCGPWTSGTATGTGEIMYNDGTMYKGDVVKGMKHGQGTLVYPDGSVYEANWVDNKLHGAGRHTVVDSNGKCTGVFEGRWEDNLKAGTGMFTYLNGGRAIVGEYTNNMRTGMHTLLYPSTDYEIHLEYINDTLVVNNQVHFLGDLVYEGTLVNDTYHGQGTLTYPDGAQFVGIFEHGKVISGQGTFHFADFTSYTGEWQKGKKHGYGTFYFKGVVVCEGEWANDRPVKK